MLATRGGVDLEGPRPARVATVHAENWPSHAGLLRALVARAKPLEAGGGMQLARL